MYGMIVMNLRAVLDLPGSPGQESTGQIYRVGNIEGIRGCRSSI